MTIAGDRGHCAQRDVPVHLQGARVHFTIGIAVFGGFDLVFIGTGGNQEGGRGAQAESVQHHEGIGAHVIACCRPLQVILAVVRAKQHRKILRSLPQYAATYAFVVLVVCFIAGDSVVCIPVALPYGEGQSSGDFVCQSTIEHALDVPQVVIATGDLQVSGVFLRGFIGKDIERATGHVPAEQGALWPAQHLDALHVEHIGPKSPGPTGKYAVDENAYRGIAAGVTGAGAHASNERLGGYLVVTAHGKTWDMARYIIDVEHIRIANGLFTQRGDGDRDGLYVLLTFLRRDNDFLQKGVGNAG